jgi:hypothetical protein
MTRSLAALACFAALFGAPSKSQADPWLGEDSFYRPSWGTGYGWGGSYYGYTAGYSPFYSGYMASYAPAYGGYYGGACCAPCGTSCCSPCGTGCGSACGTGCGSACGTGCGTSCDPGCGNCAGGNCATGTGANTVPSTPSDTGSGQNPTYAPPTSTNDRQPTGDDFQKARERSNLGTGTSTVPNSGFSPPAGGTVDPNASAQPFNPAEPSAPRRPNRPNEDMGHTPKSLEPGEKVAFKTPARLTRSNLQPSFELPAIVSAPPSTRPEEVPAPTAVASK